MDTPDTFAILLRHYRQTAGLSQEALAEQAEISRDAVRALERGRRKAPRLETVARLATALGLTPDDRAALLRAATGAPAADAAPASGWQGTPLTPPTVMIGREEEQAALQEALRREGTRLITLIGPGGVGKTRLAQAVAERMQGEYGDGIAFVDLSALRDPLQVTATLAHALGVREAGAQAPRDLLFVQLRHRHMLVLLDNFEQVVAAADQVAALLVACPRLQVLATSRTPLRLRAEHVVRVPPLATPPRANAVKPDTYPAVQLFVLRAQAVAPAFQITPANAAPIAEICRRLDGLPLAIELAAARTQILAPADLLARLRQHLDVLKSTMRDVPDRQRTLRATVDWSHALLSAGEQALFRRLAVFSGGCTLEAAEAVCTLGTDVEVLDGLTALLEHSLLRQQGDGEQARISMLETIREYALERLEASGEAQALREQHAMYYLTLAEAAEPHLVGPEQVTWLARLDRDHDNLLSAIAWARERRAIEVGLRLTGALWRFWWLRGYPGEGRAWLDPLLEQATGAAPHVLARALNGAGNLAWAQGEFERSLALHERCLSLLRALHDTAGIARSLSNLGMVAQHQGRYQDAARYLEESLAIHRLRGNERGVAGVLNNLGNVMRYLGDYERAQALHDEGLALMRTLGDTWGAASILSNLGSVAGDRGDYRRARELHEESLARLRELGDAPGMAAALINLGSVERSLGNVERARTLFEEGLTLFRDVRDAQSIALAIEAVALLAAAIGDARGAAQLYGAAHASRQTTAVARTPSERAEYERAVATLRASLGDEGYDEEWAVGRRLSLDEAIEFALSHVAPRDEGRASARPSRSRITVRVAERH